MGNFFVILNAPKGDGVAIMTQSGPDVVFNTLLFDTWAEADEAGRANVYGRLYGFKVFDLENPI